jgi:hypothetical protein
VESPSSEKRASTHRAKCGLAGTPGAEWGTGPKGPIFLARNAALKGRSSTVAYAATARRWCTRPLLEGGVCGHSSTVAYAATARPWRMRPFFHGGICGHSSHNSDGGLSELVFAAEDVEDFKVREGGSCGIPPFENREGRGTRRFVI